MAAKRKAQGDKYEPNRGRINLSFNLNDPEQRDCYYSLMQRGHPTRDVLEMWRGQSTEVLYVRSKEVLDLKSLIRDVIQNSPKNQGFSEEIEPENEIEDDAFDSMMDW